MTQDLFDIKEIENQNKQLLREQQRKEEIKVLKKRFSHSCFIINWKEECRIKEQCGLPLRSFEQYMKDPCIFFITSRNKWN